MAYIDVKITDLVEVENVKPNDLFLISHPVNNDIGGDIPYTSNSIRCDILSSAIKDSLGKDTVNVDGLWNFHTSKENIPKNDFYYKTDDFLNSLSDQTKLTSIISSETEEGKEGWYNTLDSSVLQNEENVKSGEESSLSVSNNSIPNIDYIHRLIAGLYKNIKDEIINGTIPSYIGEIIFSTTLSSEEKVKEKYGETTRWKRHCGYFLRGAGLDENNNSDIVLSASSYDDEGLKKDGGNDSIQLLSNNLPKHTHEATFYGNQLTAQVLSKAPALEKIDGAEDGGNINCQSGNGAKPNKLVESNYFISKVASWLYVKFKPTGRVTITESDGKDDPDKINILPPYKNVYIWERVV